MIWKLFPRIPKEVLRLSSVCVCASTCAVLPCSCHIHWSWSSQPYTERCRWCRCRSTRGPTPPLNTSSLCYTLRRAYRCRMMHSASCRVTEGLHCVQSCRLLYSQAVRRVYLVGVLNATPSALTRCMRRWARPWGCYHTWFQTAAAEGGTPWRTWQKRAELLTLSSAYTSSSAALPGRCPPPPLAGSTYLEGKTPGGLDTGRPCYGTFLIIRTQTTFHVLVFWKRK